MAQYTINNSNDCGNTTNSFYTECKNSRVADDRSQILTWLSPLDSREQHWEVQERRVDNVGEWVIQTEEFRRWCGFDGECEDNKQVLFCYGDPGVGKTFISSLVVDRLCDQSRGQNTAVGCFYCEVFSTEFDDFELRKAQSTASILGSLLKQMVSGIERIPDEISRALQEQKKAICGRRPQLPDVVKMLQLITSPQHTFMCIDALDECAGAPRFKLLDSLNQILEKSPRTRVFLTGRPHIRAEVEKGLAQRVVSLSISPTNGDIVRYLRARLDEDETPDAMDEGLKADILEKIPENISETFQLASLHIEPILRELTIHRRRERLSRIAEELDLGSVYGSTIDRITAGEWGKSSLGMAALMWITFAERPLRVDELCHALAIEPSTIDLNTDNIPSIATVVGCCQGLIFVDEEASTVRLINPTLQKYLLSNRGYFPVCEPHSEMAEICLTYLNSKRVRALAVTPSPDAAGTPFLEYCSIYWGVHARRGSSARVTSLALDLFQECNGHISTKLLLKQVEHLGDLDLDTHFSESFQFTGLHCASFFGIGEAVAALLKMKYYDVNARDFVGYTPLAWAALNGHIEVLGMLLRQSGVKPCIPDYNGRTPLAHAAWKGQEVAVKILLGEEVTPDKPDNGGRTPLSFAAESGHDEVVKILLGLEEVNPDKPDNHGYTPLSHAAWNGNEGVVIMLLSRQEVGPDRPDNAGRTPLSHAAENGHEGTVKILLGWEVIPDQPDDDGRTPLSFAAEGGHDEVVKILLGLEEVDPGKPDDHGYTPLSYAAWNGNAGVVKMLLSREEVDPNWQDAVGVTPLLYAAGDGHERVVEILLGREDVNPEKSEDYDRTPLMYASGNGHEGVVKILLGRKDVTPDKLDDEGRTPLSYAAGKGHGRIVEMLLMREGVKSERPDNYRRTPLSYAAGNGQEEVMEILFDRAAVYTDLRDNAGRTPLSYAAGEGHEGAVRILLGRPEVNPDKLDYSSRTALFYATENGHEGVVKILLGREDVTPNRPDDRGHTPLMLAERYDHKGVIELLKPHEFAEVHGGKEAAAVEEPKEEETGCTIA